MKTFLFLVALFLAPPIMALGLVIEPTYRGIHNDAGDWAERFGLGAAIGIGSTMPVEVGVAVGGLVREGSDLTYDMRLRLYTTPAGGLYIGGGHVMHEEKSIPGYNYGTIGYQFDVVFAELDAHKPRGRDLIGIPEFGLRFRY